MDWQEWLAAGIATLAAGAIEETVRRSFKGRRGAIAGTLAGAAAWPKIRDEVRRWLDGLGGAPA